MKEFHGEYKGEALATVNSTNTAAAVGSGSFCNSDDACAYGGGNLRGGFCYP